MSFTCDPAITRDVVTLFHHLTGYSREPQFDAARRVTATLFEGREVMRLRDTLSAELSQLIYYGFWYSPEMDFLMAAIDRSQDVIDGRVWLKLYKGNVIVTGAAEVEVI